MVRGRDPFVQPGPEGKINPVLVSGSPIFLNFAELRPSDGFASGGDLSETTLY